MAASSLKWSSGFVGVMVCLLAIILPTTLACMCSPSHPQESYCQADFVIAGHILEKSPVNDLELRGRFGQFEYIVEVDRVYKGGEFMPNEVARSFPLSFLTSPGDSLCGPKSLKIGTKYLITGASVDGELHVSSCDWVEEWRGMPSQQKQGVKSFYSKYCTKCVMQSTMKAFGSSNPSSPTSGCIYDPSPAMSYGVEDCQALYATCISMPDQACTWYHRGNSFRDCIQRNSPFYQGVETSESVNFPIKEDALT